MIGPMIALNTAIYGDAFFAGAMLSRMLLGPVARGELNSPDAKMIGKPHFVSDVINSHQKGTNASASDATKTTGSAAYPWPNLDQTRCPTSPTTALADC